MRISEQERTTILAAIHAVDPEAPVWLFGSRADDGKRGGDIDIAVRSSRFGLWEKLRARRAITDALGEQHVDLVVSADGSEPFFRLATETGVRIDG